MEVKEKIVRNLRRQACDGSNPGLANLAARTLAELGRRSDHALELAFKCKLAEQVGPQSWSAWLAEDPPESLEAPPETVPDRLVPEVNQTDPAILAVGHPSDVCQEASTHPGTVGLEEANSRALARYHAYLKADEARAEESVLPDDHEERLRQARFGYLSGR
jgi:hypothetical protein